MKRNTTFIVRSGLLEAIVSRIMDTRMVVVVRAMRTSILTVMMIRVCRGFWL